ncbi:MAG TPA: tetratricopeptide repeat protein [Azospirillum sp.]|nr:tetratricopeptide repeat protein [Azospirillum sp.]
MTNTPANPVQDLLDRALDRHRAGAWAEAEALYRRAVAVAPAHAGLLFNLGAVREAAGDAEAAAMAYARATRSAPDNASAWFNLGNARRSLGRRDGAIAAYTRALVAKPDHPGALGSLGDRLLDIDRPASAEPWLLRAVALKPDVAGVHHALGWARQRLGRVAAAVAPLRTALAIDPRLLAASEKLAECRCLLGDDAAGARQFWRYQSADGPWLRKLRIPSPTRTLRPGEALHLVADSGFGDTFQFVRYARWFAERGHRVTVEAQAPLLRVLASCAGIDAAIPTGGERPGGATAVPLHSLMHLAGASPADLGRLTPYLTADPTLVEAWSARLGGGLRVGIVWAGAPDGSANHGRSPRLAPMRPLLDMEGVRFFGLQLGDGRRDLEGASLPQTFTDLGPAITDFADTAAILAALDLLVTSDTGVAHLAGALGRPAWVLLPCVPAWRWGLSGTASAWYPTLRLYRQPAPGDWATPVRRMRADLAALVTNAPAQR